MEKWYNNILLAVLITMVGGGHYVCMEKIVYFFGCGNAMVGGRALGLYEEIR